MTEVDVAIGSWTRDEERALNVALNNPRAQGEFTDVRAYLSDALAGIGLDDFAELQFDELVFEPPQKKKGKYAEKMTEVEELDVTAINGARFEIVISGDLVQQERVLEVLRGLVGIDVKVGLAHPRR